MCSTAPTDHLEVSLSRITVVFFKISGRIVQFDKLVKSLFQSNTAYLDSPETLMKYMKPLMFRTRVISLGKEIRFSPWIATSFLGILILNKRDPGNEVAL